MNHHVASDCHQQDGNHALKSFLKYPLNDLLG
jgi:hypothetical protein